MGSEDVDASDSDLSPPPPASPLGTTDDSAGREGGRRTLGGFPALNRAFPLASPPPSPLNALWSSFELTVLAEGTPEEVSQSVGVVFGRLFSVLAFPPSFISSDLSLSKSSDVLLCFSEHCVYKGYNLKPLLNLSRKKSREQERRAVK